MKTSSSSMLAGGVSLGVVLFGMLLGGALDVWSQSRVAPPPGLVSGWPDNGDATDVVFTKITTGSIVSDGGASLGSAWGDYDGDGFLDLYVANYSGQADFLYRNNGLGSFARITTGPVATTVGDSHGCAWGDFNNDGFLDLFVTRRNGQDNRLYRNHGDGTFSSVTEGAIVSDGGDSTGAAWADYDRDGYLDLFVANYGGGNNFLYHNNGDGTFTRVTTGAVATAPANSLGCAWGDYDSDGFADLFVVNAAGAHNLLFRNNGDGTFTRITAGSMVSDGGNSMSCAWADYNNDGFLDLFAVNHLGTPNCLYRNNGDGTFTKITGGVLVSEVRPFTSCAWGDYDNDGFLDVFVALGIVGDVDNALYRNNGDGTFTKVTEGGVVQDGGNSIGSTWADYDRDGFLDLFVANYGNQNNFLYHNMGNSNSWVTIRCVGQGSNRSGIGGMVSIRATIGGTRRWQVRPLTGGDGYNSQSLEAHFGLGDAPQIEVVRVEWPSGQVTELTDVSARQMVVLTEPVSSPPVLLLEPRSLAVTAGQSVIFRSRAGGSPPLSYQWQFNGEALSDATDASLVLAQVQFDRAGQYAVVVSNALGSAISSNATLTVNPPPPCLAVPTGLVGWWAAEGSGRDDRGTNDGTLGNGVAFAGGKVGQAFRLDGIDDYVRIPASPGLDVGTGPGFTVEGWIDPADVAVSHPIVEWAPSAASGPFGVHFWVGVYRAGNLFASLPDTAGNFHNLEAGAAVVAANVFQHVALTYDRTSGIGRLYVNGAMVRETTLGIFTPRTSRDLFVGFRPPTLPDSRSFPGLIDEVSLYDRALFPAEIQAIHQAGSSGKCQAPTAPVIYAQPADQTVMENQTASFTVVAGGTPPLSYQWSFNGTNLAGATQATLTLRDLQLAQAGSYTVQITNALGSTLSSNALLTVTPAPPCVPPPSGLVSWWRAQGDANDAVGGNHGQLVNGAGFAAGMVGEAFALNGVNQYTEVPNAPSLNPTDALTIEAWVHATVNPGGGIMIVSKDNHASARQYLLSLVTVNNQHVFRAHVGVPAGFAVLTGWQGVPLNAWSHVAMTYDGSALRLYVNGTLDSTLAATGPVVATAQPLRIGHGWTGGYAFGGRIDEVGLYARALSAEEIQTVYQAGSGGKCVVPIAPFITVQPAGQTATLGGTAVFRVAAGGSPPFSYQWRREGTDLEDATNATLTLSNVQFSHAGRYSVEVANAAGSVVSSNALLQVVFPPAVVQLPDIQAPGGQLVTVPVLLVANGNENALGFSLDYDGGLLTFVDAVLGAGSVDGALFVNTNLLDGGRVGVAVALPADTTFPAGTQEVAQVSFNTAIRTNAAPASVRFGDQPMARQLSDAQANALAATYVNGTVVVAAADFEADVAPRPDGDKGLSIIDWVQVGRFAAALDVTEGGEFQRADCAPRAERGNGVLSITDWVQAGRYAAALDPLTLAGGPEGPVVLPTVKVASGVKGLGTSRRLSLPRTNVAVGETVTVAARLEALGNENAVGFSVAFDASKLRFLGLARGTGMASATMMANTNPAGQGSVGVMLGLPGQRVLSAGEQEIALLCFATATNATGSNAVAFGDAPVLCEVSDADAGSLPCVYASGAVICEATGPVGPRLGVARANDQLVLTWPVSAEVFEVQWATNGLGGDWQVLEVVPEVDGGLNRVRLTIEGGSSYFRLRRQ